MARWGSLVTRAALVGVAAWIANIIAGGVLLSGTTLAAPTGEPMWKTLLLSLVAMALIVASLIYPAVRSVRRGHALAIAIFLAILGIHVVLVWIEALAVNLLPPGEIVRGFVTDALVAAVLAFLLGRAIDSSRSDAVPASRANAPDSWNTWSWIWRLTLCAFVYLTLYIIAGTLIWPEVRPFYVAQHLEVNPAIILPLQIVRGACYVLFTLALLRSLAVTRWQASLAMAVMFPILAGVAALIIPNPVMPGWVRAWHLGEIAWSNFVYGAIVGALFWNRAPRVKASDLIE